MKKFSKRWDALKNLDISATLSCIFGSSVVPVMRAYAVEQVVYGRGGWKIAWWCHGQTGAADEDKTVGGDGFEQSGSDLVSHCVRRRAERDGPERIRQHPGRR